MWAVALLSPLLVEGAQNQGEKTGWETDEGFPPNVFYVLIAAATIGLGWVCRDDLRLLTCIILWTSTFLLIIASGNLMAVYIMLLIDFTAYFGLMYPQEYKD